MARGLNQWDNASDLRSFTLGEMHIVSPAAAAMEVSLTPTITWTAGAAGTSYLLELSTTERMTSPDTIVVDQPQWTAPRYRLAGATTYYARVTATYGDATVVTPVSSFTTVEVIPLVPVFVFPAEDNTVLYSYDVVSFEPVEGIGSLRVQISSSESFPVRTTYNGTLEGTFETPQLGTIKGTGKLVDGNTYYARARYAYRTLATGTTSQFTEYCDVRTFVYHEAIAGDVNGDLEVSVSDVNAVIGVILGITSSETVLSRADVNGDGEVTVSDVNKVISIILDK